MSDPDYSIEPTECPQCRGACWPLSDDSGGVQCEQCGHIIEPKPAETEYQIAEMRESGAWDIIESFEAADNAAANAHAEREHADREWYVLRNGKNINA